MNWVYSLRVTVGNLRMLFHCGDWSSDMITVSLAVHLIGSLSTCTSILFLCCSFVPRGLERDYAIGFDHYFLFIML